MHNEQLDATPLLTTADLCKTVGQAALLRNINMSVKPKSIYALLGPNGAGKTTLIKTLAGVIKPTSGTIRFAPDVREQMGVLIETPSLYDNLSAYDNLKVFCLLHNTPEERIGQVLELLNLTETGKKRVAHFSLGMKQRLAIASALLHNPRLLILDEPTNGLDPEGIVSLRLFIKSLPEKLGTTVIVSSHMLHEVEHIADEVGIIKNGALVYQGTLQQLKQDYPQSHNLEDIFMNLTNKQQPHE